MNYTSTIGNIDSRQLSKPLPAPLLLVTLATCVLIAILYALTPVFADDLWYTLPAKGLERGSWEATVVTFKESLRHLESDTGRLANLINAPFLSLWPRWVFGCLTGMVCMATLALCYRIVGSGLGGTSRYLMLLGYIVILPWFDYMLSIVFALNYVWSSLFGITVAYFTLRGMPGSRGKYCSVCILWFITGWMHEGLTIPLIAAVGVYMLAQGNRRERKAVFIPLMAMIAGLAVLLSAPATWARFTNTEGSIFSGDIMLFGVKFNCMFWIYCVILIIAKWKGALLGARDRATALFFLSFGIVSTCMIFALCSAIRMGWFNQLFCGIGTLWLLGRFRFRNPYPGIGAIAKSLISLFIIVHLSYACVVESRLKKEFDDITRLALASPDGKVYYDITVPKLDLSLYKTTVYAMVQKVPLDQYSDYYLGKDIRLTILPTDSVAANQTTLK